MNKMTQDFLSDSTKMRGRTVAEAVFDFLRQKGIDRIFGNPGSTELPMFMNIPEDLSYVLGLQESIVVAMADAYAQVTRGPAFVNLHSAARPWPCAGQYLYRLSQSRPADHHHRPAVQRTPAA